MTHAKTEEPWCAFKRERTWGLMGRRRNGGENEGDVEEEGTGDRFARGSTDVIIYG